ncbi:hypothetical protein BSLA_01r0820 [Burkholderia stabilis]|nr:hypothetical protein BSLA_01r0820 [Burkholderia stabilis]
MKYRRTLILRSIRISISRTLTGIMEIAFHKNAPSLARQGSHRMRPAARRRQSGKIPTDACTVFRFV